MPVRGQGPGQLGRHSEAPQSLGILGLQVHAERIQRCVLLALPKRVAHEGGLRRHAPGRLF
jgi:hypothetical protein